MSSYLKINFVFFRHKANWPLVIIWIKMKNYLIPFLTLFNIQRPRRILLAINSLLCAILIVTISYQIYSINLLSKENHIFSILLTKPNTENYTFPEKIHIKNWNLFDTKNNASINRAKPTKWILRGIILGDNLKNSLAIIASHDRDEAIYAIGDKLTDGTVIKKILPNEIVLEYNGKLNKLSIPWDTENQILNSKKSIPLNFGQPFSLMK